MSLWLSRRIHNCYLMARKEIANKYSLHSLIPFLRTTMRTVALKISIMMRQTGNSLLFKFIWLTCFQKKIWPTFLKYFIFCGGLTDCDRICVRGDNEDMCARGSCPLSTKGGELAWTLLCKGSCTAYCPILSFYPKVHRFLQCLVIPGSACIVHQEVQEGKQSRQAVQPLKAVSSPFVK